eukprot:TRINITY_DN1173_c0_g1_i1.p1 TRINITY_DN1173_c0_g1~~TRINITY_DN1173_c0_g1_i1.p1  ORF type:complete len:348 (-),score=54.24 TRINITY_DN1173_c0_g1_i1:68-1063(-)
MSFKKKTLIIILCIWISLSLLPMIIFSPSQIQYHPTYQTCSEFGFVFYFYHDVGFGSEMNNMFNAALYAQMLNRTFYLNSDVWNYGNWSDFFERPHGCYYDYEGRQHDSVMMKGNADDFDGVQKDLYIKRDPIIHFTVLTNGIGYIANMLEDSVFKEKGKVAKSLWRLNRLTQAYVDAYVERVMPSEEERGDSVLIGMHIRRGDKVEETDLQGVGQYYKKAKEISGDKSFQLYIASDDISSVIRDMRRLDKLVPVYIDEDSMNHKGHKQSEFNRLSKEQRIEETKEFIATLESLLMCDIIICTFSSNICRLLAILSPTENVYSIDTDWYYI